MTIEEQLKDIEKRLTALEEKNKDFTINLDGRAVYETILKHDRQLKERGTEWLQN